MPHRRREVSFVASDAIITDISDVGFDARTGLFFIAAETDMGIHTRRRFPPHVFLSALKQMHAAHAGFCQKQEAEIPISLHRCRACEEIITEG